MLRIKTSQLQTTDNQKSTLIFKDKAQFELQFNDETIASLARDDTVAV